MALESTALRIGLHFPEKAATSANRPNRVWMLGLVQLTANSEALTRQTEL